MAVRSAGRSIRLHELLAGPGVHVLLDRDADRLDTLALGPLVHMHRLTSRPGRGLITVRPDGYIGFRCEAAEEDQLAAWLSLAGVGVSCAAAERGQFDLASQEISLRAPERGR